MPRRRRISLWVLTIAIFAGSVVFVGERRVPAEPASGTSFSYVAAQADVRPTLRVGTFNIAGGQKSNLDTIAANLKNLDVVALNEVHGSASGKDQAEILGEKLKMAFLFAPTERRWWYASFGNGVLSDLPVESWEIIRLPGPNGNAPRNLVVAKMKWGERTIHVLVAHADWKPDGVLQREAIATKFLSLPSPAILMGDLNANGDDPSIAKLRASADVVDALVKVPGLSKDEHVDWILVRGFDVLSAAAVDNGASDHPVFGAELKINAEVGTRNAE